MGKYFHIARIVMTSEEIVKFLISLCYIYILQCSMYVVVVIIDRIKVSVKLKTRTKLNRPPQTTRLHSH